METLFIPLSLMAGALLAVQAGANAQLSKAVGSPVMATTLQLSVGRIVLLVVAIATGTIAAAQGVWQAEWWHVIGGVASAFYVASTILLFPRLGAVTSVGLFIAGQMLTSFFLDGFGLIGVTSNGIQTGALVGTAIVVLGAALIVLGQDGGYRAISWSRLGWIALALAAGAVLPMQGAVNALLRRDLGGATFAVGTISFFVATIAMLILLASLSLWPGAQRGNPRNVGQVPWWGWLGGFAGATYVTTVFAAIPVIGAGATVGLTVAGQQLASLLVDQYGWLRLPKRPASRLRLIGVVLLFVVVALIKAI